jgi:hypothetical protein
MRQLPSLFTKYEFSDRELLEAKVLPVQTLAYLQTLQTKFAEEKITLKFDPNKQMEFVQREAELQGQILLLAMLLQESDDAAEALKTFKE